MQVGIADSPSKASTRLSHLSALDGVRGVAVLLVLPHHIRRIIEPFDTWSYAWVKFGDLGWLGVQLFFVLSGFLITRILLAAQPAANYYTSFYGRRFLRIFPVYYSVLAVWWFLLPLVHPESPRADARYGYLWLFLSNWTQPYHPSGHSVAHYWSLAVEEQFYLVWPFVLRRLRAQSVFVLCCVLALAALGIRTGMTITGWPEEAVYEWTICRMDALALGAAVAAALAVPGWREKMAGTGAWLRYSPWVVFLLGAAITKFYRQFEFVPITFGYSLAGLAFALWIMTIALDVNPPGMGLLRTGFFRSAGKLSYAMYVFHVPISASLDALLLGPMGWLPAVDTVGTDLIRVAIFGAVVWGTAMLSYRFFEAPILSLKRHFELKYPRSEAAPVG